MSLVATLQQCPEPLPQWLRQPSPEFDRASLFGSRTVFYPGSGDDGQPVKVCARAHAAHAFIYVDYGVSQRTLEERLHGLEGQGLRGYRVVREQPVVEAVLRPGGWTPHVDPAKLRKDVHRFASVTPFAFFVVLSRDADHGPDHGPERLAMLFIGGDGHATYDALYGQNDGTPPPFLVVIQDYGFGGNYARFGAGGLLERIAHECDVKPLWLLVGRKGSSRYEPWTGYRDAGVPGEPGGMHAIPRRLFLREGRSYDA